MVMMLTGHDYAERQRAFAVVHGVAAVDGALVVADEMGAVHYVDRPCIGVHDG